MGQKRSLPGLEMLPENDLVHNPTSPPPGLGVTSNPMERSNSNSGLDGQFTFSNAVSNTVEPENVAIIVVFFLLVFSVMMTGLIAYNFCGREPIIHQPRSWASLISVLVLTVIRSNADRDAEAAGCGGSGSLVPPAQVDPAVLAAERRRRRRRRRRSLRTEIVSVKRSGEDEEPKESAEVAKLEEVNEEEQSTKSEQKAQVHCEPKDVSDAAAEVVI